ncbi:5-methylcytosine g t mismatch-specific dna [Pleurostoma richardsiae]|uniref:5-methylcytosine g t mismatch-specific dna n=1 Tax=Pleurostoma richardsiae TaxID=41990 RepID=A0AA38S3C5_9PEZI|nr:5-methylcytosine g t mismatch-specific dna [Pleurostoma richardsiae]
MTSKERDLDTDDRPNERRRSKSEKSRSERDKDGEKDKDRDKDRSSSHRHHKSSTSRSTRSKLGLVDAESYLSYGSSRRHRPKDERSARERAASSSMTDLVPELARSSERVHVPYPSFSKAHSKEAVHSREDVSSPAPRRTDPLTPEATDVGASDLKRSKSADYSSTRKGSSSRNNDRPPSPPATNLSGEKRRGTPSSMRERELGEERPRSRVSSSSRPTSRNDDRSKVSMKSKSSSQATFIKSPSFRTPTAATRTTKDQDSVMSGRKGSSSSTATSVVPPRRSGSARGSKPEPIEVVDDSPESAQDSSSPKTPTNSTPQFPPPPMFHDGKHELPHHLRFEPPEQAPTPATDFSAAPPPPPPPPPPALNIQEAPRVDYLMQNGGLPQPVPKNFLAVLPRPNGTRPSNPPLRGAETLFSPFFNLLDQYNNVLNNHGSIAVATGHRTVARRLLDRLENVFSRDLPPDGCSCIMCERSDVPHRGLGWGEVLERVSGRIEIPSWPPFDLAILAVKAVEDSGDVPPRPASPVKMDPDIAEEFREHYLRQSKKVKAAVDSWLTNCAESPAPPPQDVDDETLTFAILTNLDQEERPFFNALISGARELQPAVRAPTPGRKPRTDFLVKSGLAIQRLYRLQQVPRDAETVMYLVKHPHMHDLLHTLSDIHPSEWEILISGRFDGFLWSGADDDDAVTPTAENPSRRGTPASHVFPPSRSAALSPGGIARFTPALGIGTRNTTPFSRGATPASFVSGTSMASSAAAYPNRQAVTNDEETEIAALAELEREIFLGMEALEDAFETLHQRAELVRTALRQRSAGLSVSLQRRRGGVGASRIDVLPQSGGSSGAYDRPAWAADDDGSMASESDWGGDDFELAPDDSASQISSSRQRRPKRRDERRTPAPIQEEDEV